jgi:hypothetical protein
MIGAVKNTDLLNEMQNAPYDRLKDLRFNMIKGMNNNKSLQNWEIFGDVLGAIGSIAGNFSSSMKVPKARDEYSGNENILEIENNELVEFPTGDVYYTDNSFPSHEKGGATFNFLEGTNVYSGQSMGGYVPAKEKSKRGKAEDKLQEEYARTNDNILSSTVKRLQQVDEIVSKQELEMQNIYKSLVAQKKKADDLEAGNKELEKYISEKNEFESKKNKKLKKQQEEEIDAQEMEMMSQLPDIIGQYNSSREKGIPKAKYGFDGDEEFGYTDFFKKLENQYQQVPPWETGYGEGLIPLKGTPKNSKYYFQ